MARTSGGWYGRDESGYVLLERAPTSPPAELLRTVLSRRSSEPAPWLYVAGAGLGAALGAATHLQGSEGIDAVPVLVRVAGGVLVGAGAVWLVFASTAITTPLELVPLRVALLDVIDPAGRDERELHHLRVALRRTGLRVVVPITDDDAETHAAGRAHGREGLLSAGFAWQWPDRSVLIEVSTDHERAMTDARLGGDGQPRREGDTTVTVDGLGVPGRRFDTPDGSWVVVAELEHQAVAVHGHADAVDPAQLRLRRLPRGELPPVSTRRG